MVSAVSVTQIVISVVILFIGAAIAAEFSCTTEQLCSQDAAYSRSNAIVATEFFVHDHPCVDRELKSNEECVLCGQLNSTKEIWCTRDTSHSVRMAFKNATAPVHGIDLIAYTQNRSNASPLDRRDMATSRRDYYVVPIEETELDLIMQITEPPYGSLVANDLYIGLKLHSSNARKHDSDGSAVDIDGTVQGATADKPPGLQFQFEAVGVFTGTYPGELSHLASTDIEPASWFYSIRPTAPRGGMGEVSQGYPTYGYIEFVLRPEQINAQRRFVQPPVGGGSDSKHSLNALLAQVPAKTASDSLFGSLFGSFHTPPKAKKANICIWSSDNLDGQKRIWLDQTEHLNAERFNFTWILSLNEGKTLAALEAEEARIAAGGSRSSAGSAGSAGGASTKPSLHSALQRLLARRGNGRVIDSPYNNVVLDVDALEMDPGDGRAPLAATWTGDELDLYRYAHDSLVRANFSIDRVQPGWCRQFYSILRDALPPLACSAIVYGNERGFSADVLVTDAARILGIPTVAELLNLYVHKDVLPTVLVAPSTFAVEHDSIQMALREKYSVPAPKKLGDNSPRAVVIPPSVDTRRFDPSIYRARKFPPQSFVEEGVYAHPSCRARGSIPLDASGRPVRPCIIVGFIARLSPEKSVGLFLQAAHEILRLHPFARFTVVGDGVLRASLEDLAARLQISWAVHFTGWVVGDDLPGVLAGMDIVVNPSLRAWSETFCISNIEAMSMEVPLVTFAVGGIGEYVLQPPSSAPASNATADFVVSENALILNTATPTAVASAVLHLAGDKALRRRIGRAGRQTVLRNFATARQMGDYEKLYTHLHSL